MATVTFDDRSFLIDGKRIWLVSGSVHYFRTPAALWADRLLKAKRGGLNCIDTYVAWNFHEMQEGKWDFTGDRDIVAFAKLVGQMGMYLILRPGPYICSEWDFGGLPSWLTTKPGMAYRTNNAAYTHYYDKYFRQVLPRLADLQITRGGNIILIQNENEYFTTTMPDRLSYLEFINQLFRRSGFDIPIISCNWQSEPAVPDCVECINAWDKAIPQLKKLRIRQPNAPLLMTEFWNGWYDNWGGSHQTRDAREVARRALEITGCGAQINYYMWHGGTNFGFWGSRLGDNEATWHTTSYDLDAPLAEGGGLTEKYCQTKLVNMFAQHMGPFLAGCTMGEPGVTAQDVPQVFNLQGERGRWAIITNNGRDDIRKAQVSLPREHVLEVSLEPFGAVAIPVGLKLSPERTLEFANLMPLGFFHDKILVLHGPAGFPAHLCINGKTIKAAVPSDDAPTVIPFEDLVVILISSDMAMRTWLVEQMLIFGPRFVGQTAEDVVHAPGGKDYFLIGPEGKLLRKKQAKPAAPAKLAVPKLAPWKFIAGNPELVVRSTEAPPVWQKIDRPRDVDSLGVPYGYLWYRVEINSPAAGTRHLFLPDCQDRANLFLNGTSLGIWGRGEGAHREPMAAKLVKGANTMVALVDNLGRFNYGSNIGELKGLYGHIYDAREIKPAKVKLKPEEVFARRLIPRRMTHLMPMLESSPVWLAQIELALPQVRPVHVSFRDVPHVLTVLCNDRQAGFFVQGSFGDVTLNAELQKGRNRVDILLWGDVTPAVLKNFSFWSLAENLTESAAWSFRPWAMPPITDDPGRKHGDHPGWYRTHFRGGAAAEPLFLRLAGKGKGQIFLNGHNVGRYWTIGPQEFYYLPSCWLAEENELTLFEEMGNPPAHCSLEFRSGGPYR